MAGGGCFRCLRFLVLRWEYMKSTEPRPENIQAAEPVEQQLKCPNHDCAFSKCLWFFRERDGAFSEHDVSVLSNPSLKLKNLFSMSTLVDPGNHLRMLHNTIAGIDGPKKRTANRLFEYTLYTLQCQCWSQPKYVKSGNYVTNWYNSMAKLLCKKH